MRQLPITRTLLAFALITMVAAPALAGPPLVCLPYDIGPARSLPWDTNGHAWRGVRADYPLSQLTDDTLALLTPATPVVVRMETLRRAALYATKDPAIARALLTTLLDRARAKGADSVAALDAGYLVETYKQTQRISPATAALAANIDGYALASRSLATHEPAIEFAAAMMTADGRRGAYAEHVRLARTGATADQLLARNIAQLER
jgi:hypothetical protein